MALRAQKDGTDWMALAACGGMDPELWFPPEKQQDDFTERRIRLAKSICSGCPVRERCLVQALRTGQRFGIWGGLLARERSASKYCQQLRREFERESYADAGAAGRRASYPPR